MQRILEKQFFAEVNSHIIFILSIYFLLKAFFFNSPVCNGFGVRIFEMYGVVWFNFFFLFFQPNIPLPPLWKLFLAWLFREFSWLAFFLQAACGREIEWRTSHFVLQLGGKAERLQEKCQDLGNHCC